MTNVIFNPYRTIYISPPGDTLANALEEQELTEKDFAVRLGESEATVKEIIDGKAAITTEIASKLEAVLDIPATFWNNRERNYREALAKQAELRPYIPDEFEAITIFAFLEALRRLENPLPCELKSKIKQWGQALLTDTKNALSGISILAKDDSLKGLYWQVRQEINQQYQIQEAGSETEKEDTEALCELVSTLIDIVDSPNPQEEVKEFAPDLDELSESLFNLVLV
jgi:plasmid maintenance system antidote protein VapI